MLESNEEVIGVLCFLLVMVVWGGIMSWHWKERSKKLQTIIKIMSGMNENVWEKNE